jgi:hypothetical protein
VLDMPGTSAIDIVMGSIALLDEGEQEEVLARLTQRRLERQTEDDSETARMVRSLRSVAEELGHTPTVTEYREAERRRRGTEEALEETNRIIRYFGSWRVAKEALDLSESSSVRKIEARFAARRLGKVWAYTEDTLRETLARCVAHYGRPPQVAEFEWWRQRELELARAQGDDALHLPGSGPYRRRWKSWEKALRACGYSPEEAATRLERRWPASSRAAGLPQSARN